MKVLAVILEDFPGSEARLQRQVRALVSAGHEVRIIAARGTSTQSTWEGARILRTTTSKRKSGGTKRRLFEYVAFGAEALIRSITTGLFWRPDVIQVANMPDTLVFSALPLKLVTGARLVFDMHDLMPEVYAARGGGPIVRALTIAERAAVAAADEVLTVTPMCVDRVWARHPSARVSLVPNAVGSSVRHTADGGHPSPPLRVVYVGTVTQRFGVDVLCAAVDSCVSQGIALSLDVFGDGDALARLESAYGERRAALRFHGQLPHSDVMHRLPEYHVGVVPYKDSQFMRLAFSTKAFEYSAAGLVCLLADIPSMRLQMEGSDAIFFDSSEPESLSQRLSELAELDDRDRRAIGESMAEWVGIRWTWEGDWANSYVDIITSVASGRTGRRTGE